MRTGLHVWLRTKSLMNELVVQFHDYDLFCHFDLPDQRGGLRRPSGPRACLCHPSRPHHAEGSEESGGETAEGFKKQLYSILLYFVW